MSSKRLCRETSGYALSILWGIRILGLTFTLQFSRNHDPTVRFGVFGLALIFLLRCNGFESLPGAMKQSVAPEAMFTTILPPLKLLLHSFDSDRRLPIEPPAQTLAARILGGGATSPNCL